MFIRSALAAIAVCTSTHALAQQTCAPRDVLTAKLEEGYSEAQTAAGLQSTSRMVEVWASHDGSWTILITNAQGVSCILASGTHWAQMEPPIELSGVPG